MRLLKLKPTIIYSLALSLVFCSTPSLANITDYRFYQANDVQRDPAFPVANSPFTISYFQDPYRADLTQYKLKEGEYIQLFFVGGVCQDGKVGIKHYDARGNLLETVQATGHIYGLTPAGFLHDNDNDIGTFILSQFWFVNKPLTYTPSTGPAPETCAALEAYTTTPQPPIETAIKEADFSFTTQLFNVNQRLQESSETLATQEKLLAEYQQQINQLKQQLSFANKLRRLQTDYIQTLEKTIDQYLQLLVENTNS